MENMLKTDDFLLRKALKVDWLDYLMNDIRFFLRLNKAFKNEKYTLVVLFFNHLTWNTWALAKDLPLHILSLNRFGATTFKEKGTLTNLKLSLLKSKGKNFKIALGAWPFKFYS